MQENDLGAGVRHIEDQEAKKFSFLVFFIWKILEILSQFSTMELHLFFENIHFGKVLWGMNLHSNMQIHSLEYNSEKGF